MPFKKGQGGRQKGAVNKRSLELADRLKEWGCDPFHVLAITAKGDVPCGVCKGTGKTKFQPRRRASLQDQDLDIVEDAQPGERTCQSCWGSGKERISPKERSWAASELAQYVEAKRKAVDVSGQIEHGLPDLPMVLRKRFESRQKS